MGNSIRLVVLDIDGTIVGSANQVSAPVKQAIRDVQAKGIRVAIATGRMYRSALRFHTEVGSDLPLISYQGAFVKDPRTQEVVGHWPVALPYALALLDDFEELVGFDRLSVHVYVNDELYVRELTPQTADYARRSRVEPTVVGDLREFLQENAAGNPPTKVLALSDDPDTITALLATLQQRYNSGQLYLTKSVATYFEATHPTANKGMAVKYLAETLLGFDRAEVMAVGDNFNDLEMIAYAGLGVAMGNAPDDLKAVADWVAPGVDEDGAAVALRKLLL